MPMADRPTPFQTTSLRTMRLPRFRSACFVASIAENAQRNQSSTLKCSILFTQNGAYGIGGSARAPSKCIAG